MNSSWLNKQLKGLSIAALLLGIPWSNIKAEDSQAANTDLFSLSLDELMNMSVSSVARRDQKISDAAAAVYVVTSEDIRRSGATTIPEALRGVPGIQVARIDNTRWAITSRGFNAGFADKLLVLFDGRVVFTQLFNGVYWDEQDYVLDDIERIEVIRGPGATMWGANAVNGIINIISKNSKNTLGNFVTAGGGSSEEYFTSARHGAKVGEDTNYRVYAKYSKRDNSYSPQTSGEAFDGWENGRIGFRTDWDNKDSDKVTVQGDLYHGHENLAVNVLTVTPPFAEELRANDDVYGGGNILARHEHAFSKTSDTKLQMSFDRRNYEEKLLQSQHLNTIDVDFQHRYASIENHELMWGLGYRWWSDELVGSDYFAFTPDSRQYSYVNGFVQDEYALVKDKLFLTVGSKLEHNDWSGVEVQPSARFLWKATQQQSIWGAVSRAVRTPSRSDRDVRIAGASLAPTPMGMAMVSFNGNDDIGSEDVMSYELGYRAELATDLSFDVATFINDYSNLRTGQIGTPGLSTVPMPPHIDVPLNLANKMDATTLGAEFAINYKPIDWWRIAGTYSYFHSDSEYDETTSIAVAGLDGGFRQDPRNMFSLRSLMDVACDTQLDATLRYVDNIPGLNVPQYMELDLRVAWRPVKDIEFAVVGQNLLHPHHLEYINNLAHRPAVELDRGVYGKVTYFF